MKWMHEWMNESALIISAFENWLRAITHHNTPKSKDNKTLIYRRDSARRRRSWSFNVTEFCTNWKPICDFLLVNLSDLEHFPSCCRLLLKFVLSTGVPQIYFTHSLWVNFRLKITKVWPRPFGQRQRTGESLF